MLIFYENECATNQFNMIFFTRMLRKHASMLIAKIITMLLFCESISKLFIKRFVLVSNSKNFLFLLPPLEEAKERQLR